MKSTLLTDLRLAAAEWARIHQVETTLIKARFSGIGENVHMLVVARRGFENWPAYERHKSLFDFLHQQANTNGGLFISRLSMMTEEEYERYEGLELETTTNEVLASVAS